MWELYLEEKLLPEVLSRVLTSQSNVVDVGCHIGSFISLANKYASEGQHVLVEPTPFKCKILRSKFPTATLHQVAVSDIAGVATFEEDLEKPGYSRLQGEHASDRTVRCYEVEVKKLDDLLIRRVHLLKLDIEGNELSALRGAEKIIARDRPPIIFECGSDHSMREIGKSRHDLYDFITNRLDYSVFTFADFLHGKTWLSFSEFEKCGVYPFRAFNFIALPSSLPRAYPANPV